MFDPQQWGLVLPSLVSAVKVFIKTLRDRDHDNALVYFDCSRLFHGYGYDRLQKLV